jgi:hypothetical protein
VGRIDQLTPSIHLHLMSVVHSMRSWCTAIVWETSHVHATRLETTTSRRQQPTTQTERATRMTSEEVRRGYSACCQTVGFECAS